MRSFAAACVLILLRVERCRAAPDAVCLPELLFIFFFFFFLFCRRAPVTTPGTRHTVIIDDVAHGR